MFDWDKAVGRPPPGELQLVTTSAHKVGAYLVVNTDRWLATSDLEGESIRRYENFFNAPLTLPTTFPPDRIAGLQGSAVREYDLDDPTVATWSYRGNWADSATVVTALYPGGAALYVPAAQDTITHLDRSGALERTAVPTIGGIANTPAITFDEHFFMGSTRRIGATCIHRVTHFDDQITAGPPTPSGCFLMRSADGFWAMEYFVPGGRTVWRLDQNGNEAKPPLHGATFDATKAVEWGDYVLEASGRGVTVWHQSDVTVPYEEAFAFIAFRPGEYIDNVFVLAEGTDAWIVYRIVGLNEVRIQKLVYPPTFQPLRQ